MATNPIDEYRDHPVWALLGRKIDNLASAEYGKSDLEASRLAILDVLNWARASADNPAPSIYRQQLDELQSQLNSISPDEQQFRHYFAHQRDQLFSIVRQLPGPPVKGLTKAMIGALDSSIETRKRHLEQLRADVEVLRVEAKALTAKLQGQEKSIAAQNDRITSAIATIGQVVDTAEDRLTADWENRLESWDTKRTESDREADRELFDRLQLLAGSASVGRRLVEQAAGSLTATDWASRAKRERANAMWLRIGAFLFFVSAVAAGAWILDNAIRVGFELTVGDGILRGALILAVAGVGTVLSAESRRHFREADSAEEVQLAFTAIEPFYADAPADERSTVRTALGDTVFVKNVLSRFANRDASKHSGSSSQDLSEVIDLLTKSTELAKKLNTPPTSN